MLLTQIYQIAMIILGTGSLAVGVYTLIHLCGRKRKYGYSRKSFKKKGNFKK